MCYNICPADLEFSEAPDVTDFLMNRERLQMFWSWINRKHVFRSESDCDVLSSTTFSSVIYFYEHHTYPNF